jgi:hypothetical protein
MIELVARRALRALGASFVFLKESQPDQNKQNNCPEEGASREQKCRASTVTPFGTSESQVLVAMLGRCRNHQLAESPSRDGRPGLSPLMSRAHTQASCHRKKPHLLRSLKVKIRKFVKSSYKNAIGSSGPPLKCTQWGHARVDRTNCGKPRRSRIREGGNQTGASTHLRIIIHCFLASEACDVPLHLPLGFNTLQLL